MISCKLVGCRVCAQWSFSKISITVLNLNSSPNGKASPELLLIPALPKRVFLILVLGQRWVLWIKRQWLLISEENVFKKCRTVSRKETSPTESGQEPGIPIEPCCPTLQSLHASSKCYFHSKKPQLLFILPFPHLRHVAFQGRQNIAHLNWNGCSLILMEIPWHKQVKVSEKAVIFFIFSCHFFSTHGRITELGCKGPLRVQVNPLQWAETFLNRSGLSETHPAWPWMFPWMDHPPSQRFW